MAYTDFTGKAIIESFGRFRATAYEAIAAGDLVYFDTTAEAMYVADAEDSMAAHAVALEDIAADAEGWFALAALVRKPPTASTSAACEPIDRKSTRLNSSHT